MRKSDTDSDRNTDSHFNTNTNGNPNDHTDFEPNADTNSFDYNFRICSLLHDGYSESGARCDAYADRWCNWFNRIGRIR